MQRARRFLWLSVILLGVSFCALVASLTVEWSWIVTLLLWNHVAVVIPGVVAVHSMMWGRHRWSSAARRAAAQRSFLLWLIALGVAVTIVAPFWAAARFDMGKTETGEVVTSRYFYPKDGRYFLAVNNGPAKEISKVEYDELVRHAYEFFATLWVVFSCINVCLWGYMLRAESDHPTP